MGKICIIGSGITALAQAWAHTCRGDDCLLLESSDRIGGAIQSFREGAYLAEEGPNSIQVNSLEVERFLCSVPGLEERTIEADAAAKNRFIVRGGRLHAVPSGPFSAITSPLWSLAGKLRVLKEPFVSPADSDVEESAADFVRRRLGAELYQYAINPLIGGIYAGNPEQLSLRYAFPKLYALEQEHGSLIRGAIRKMRAARSEAGPKVRKRIVSFRDGLHELPRHLHAALGSKAQTGVSIRSIQNAGSGWSVTWNGQSQVFDRVVSTVPFHALARLPFDPSVKEALDSLPPVDYPPVSVLTLALKRSDVAHPLDGFGALVPECEQRKILGVLFPSSVFPGRAPEDEVLLTVFIGGERQPELATADTNAVCKLALEELKELLGARGAPTFIHHRHWEKAIPQYKIGYGTFLKKVGAVERQFPGLHLAGNYRTGISLSYCIESAQRGLEQTALDPE